MEKTLRLLNAWRYEGKFCFELFPIRWCLGRRRLTLVTQDLLYWLLMYEKDELRRPMQSFSESRASEQDYSCLFAKLPELGDYLVYRDGTIDFKETVPIERRLELARYVNSLPTLLKFQSESRPRVTRG